MQQRFAQLRTASVNPSNHPILIQVLLPLQTNVAALKDSISSAPVAAAPLIVAELETAICALIVEPV